MTTAHRPTWKAAVGKAQEGGWTAGGAPSTNRSVLDAPSHTKLKTRINQHALQEKNSTEREYILKQSLLKLRQMEEKKNGGMMMMMNKKSILGPRKIDEKVEEEGRRKLLMSENDIDDVQLKNKYDDADADGAGGCSDDGKNNDEHDDIDDILGEESDLDASDSDSDNDEDDDSDDDDEDEEDLLQAELAKIRAEREKAKAKADAEAAAEEQERLEEAALIGNPLLNTSSAGAGGIGGKMKRKWNDDVVFRNQAKGEPEMNKKRFINDTVRNDFHKRFLNKFIR